MPMIFLKAKNGSMLNMILDWVDIEYPHVTDADKKNTLHVRGGTYSQGKIVDETVYLHRKCAKHVYSELLVYELGETVYHSRRKISLSRALANKVG